MSALRLPAALGTRAGLLTCGYYTALFLGIGAHLPYWPVWMAAWGLDDAEIGTFLGLALVVRLGANAVMSALADRYAWRRAMLTVNGAAAALVFVLHVFAETRGELLALTLLVTLTLSPMIPIGEALGLRAAQQHGFEYAHARAVGSVAFLAMNIGLGAAIAGLGPDVAVWTMAVCCAAMAVFGFLHPGGGAPPGAGRDTAELSESWALMRRPVVLLFVFAVSLGQASHAVYYTFGSLAWAERGIGTEVIGLLWATGVVVETWVMLGPGARWVRRLGPSGAVAAGALAGVLRWGVMAIGPPDWAFWPLQALHALTFGLAHLGAMAFVAAALPPRMGASAQGLLIGTVSGVLLAAATFAAGWVGEVWATEAAYWLAAAMSLASLCAAWMLSRAWRGEALAD